MFPIPFNFPFRKSNGSMTTIGDAISEGGGSYTLPTASADTKGGVKIGSGLTMSGEVLNATAELPEYSQATAGKVLTVDENGDLEWDTKGSGGGNYVMSWDFTKFGNITRCNVSYSSAGATFDNTNDYIPLYATDSASNQALKNITIYVDVATLSLTSGTHRRFIMSSADNGFIYRSSGVWAFYANEWQDTEITDGDYFTNSKIKIYIDNDSKWHIYKNNVLIFEPTRALPLLNLYIGASSTSINNGVITGVRVYSGDYTE